MILPSYIKRLLLFFVAVPGLVLLVFVDYFYYLGINLLIMLMAAGGSYEMALLLKRCGYPVSRIVAILLGPVVPLSQYLHSFAAVRDLPLVGWLSRSWLLTAAVVLAFALPVFAPRRYSMKVRIQIAIGYIVLFIYPGFLMSYWVELTQRPNPVFLLLLFMLSVQLNDSLAWLVGVLFGRGRNVVVVSPNKSLTGFIGGICATVLLFALARLLLPRFFNLDLSWWWLLLISISLALLAILGDLVESMLKRAAEVKDSGRAIFGRGGVLDSTDSLLLAAPLYLYLTPVFAALGGGLNP